MPTPNVIEKQEERGAEQMPELLGVDSKEYRNAFLKNLIGEKLNGS